MTTRLHALAAALLLGLAGCAAPVPAEEGAPRAETDPADDSLRELFGQWQVVSVAGRAPEYHEALLLFGEDWWHMQSQCIWADGDFAVAGERLDFASIERRFAGLPEDYRPLEAMCARGLSPTEEELPRILSGSKSWRISDDRLTVGEGAAQLVAERLPAPVVNPMGYTEWDPSLVWGRWRVASVDGQPVEDAELVRTARRMSLRTGCAYYQWIMVVDDGGMRQRPMRRVPFASGCDAGNDRLAEAVEAADRYEAVGTQGRLMRGPQGAVTLER